MNRPPKTPQDPLKSGKSAEPDSYDRLPQIGDSHALGVKYVLGPDTVARLETYEQLLRRWQSAVNLVAKSSLDQVWQRHFADSAQLFGMAPEAKHWLDIGSGAGFPGLVIALIGADAGIRVCLVESSERKCAFLAEVARETDVAVEIRNERIESYASQRTVARSDVVTARGLAPLEKILRLSAPLFGANTVGLFLKGRQAESEVEAAKRDWTFHVKLVPSRTDRSARIVEVRNPAAKR